MLFKDIPGLNELKQTLVSSHERNHIAHAQLFYGTEGGAALSLTLSFAAFLLCQQRQNGESCGNCISCQQMKRLTHPDVHFFYPRPGTGTTKEEKEKEKIDEFPKKWREFLLENPYGNLTEWVSYIDAENKFIQLSRDMARQVVRAVSMASVMGGYKIIFIWYPELMHPSAANALLKVLEEPPKKTLYFLVTYNHENIIPTIQSRTQLVVVPQHTTDEIAEHLVSKYQLDQNKGIKAARSSNGSIGRALTLATEDAQADLGFLTEWLRACFKPDFGEILEHCESFAKMTKIQQQSFLLFFLDTLRNLLYYTHTEDEKGYEESELDFYRKFSKIVSIDALAGMSNATNRVLGYIPRNANAKMAMFDLSFSLARIFKPENP